MADNFLSARKDCTCLYGLVMSEIFAACIKSPLLSSFCESCRGIKKCLLTGAGVVIIGPKREKRADSGTKKSCTRP